jgi:hypothetical protein
MLIDALNNSGSNEVVRSTLERTFECDLEPTPRLEIHRYSNGSSIGAHTDFASSEVRVVAALNRAWRPTLGGVWRIAANSELTAAATHIPSLSNSAFAFATSPTTFHALSRFGEIVSYGVTIRFSRIRR